MLSGINSLNTAADSLLLQHGPPHKLSDSLHVEESLISVAG